MSGNATSDDRGGEYVPPYMPRHQNDGEIRQVWAMRHGDGFGFAAYAAAARRMGQIDASWSRTATSCCEKYPCYSCCLRALRALEAASQSARPE